MRRRDSLLCKQGGLRKAEIWQFKGLHGFYGASFDFVEDFYKRNHDLLRFLEQKKDKAAILRGG